MGHSLVVTEELLQYLGSRLVAVAVVAAKLQMVVVEVLVVAVDRLGSKVRQITLGDQVAKEAMVRMVELVLKQVAEAAVLLQVKMVVVEGI